MAAADNGLMNGGDEEVEVVVMVWRNARQPAARGWPRASFARWIVRTMGPGGLV